MTPLHPMAPVPYRVRRTRRETHDTMTIHLDASERAEGFPFKPGQFNMLYAFGVGEVAISISGNPAQPADLVHTVRGVGAVSNALAGLRRGDVVGVRGPFGTPWPLERARGLDVLIVAGGLGLAPLMSAIHHCLAHRDAYGELAVVVGARTPEDLAFHVELARWERDSRLQTRITVDRAGPDWHRFVGVVPALIPRARFDPTKTIALVCGPEVMMRFTVRELVRRGIPDDRIFLSLERNMKCAVGWCGHCQVRELFICKDGPVVPHHQVRPLLSMREV